MTKGAGSGRAGLVLLAVAAMLGAVLAAEIALDQSTLVEAPARPTPATPAGGAPVRLADQSPAWVAAILARPLFNTDRRPVAVDAAAGPGVSLDLPRLSGVMVTASGRRAIFAGSGNGRAVTVAEGGRIGAFTVSRIDNGVVTLTGPEGSRILRPSFASGAEAALLGTPRDAALPGLPAADQTNPSGLDILRNQAIRPIQAAPTR